MGEWVESARATGKGPPERRTQAVRIVPGTCSAELDPSGTRRFGRNQTGLAAESAADGPGARPLGSSGLRGGSHPPPDRRQRRDAGRRHPPGRHHRLMPRAMTASVTVAAARASPRAWSVNRIQLSRSAPRMFGPPQRQPLRRPPLTGLSRLSARRRAGRKSPKSTDPSVTPQVASGFHFSISGESSDNACTENLDGRFGDECPDTQRFLSQDDARANIEVQARDHDVSPTHTSLGFATPAESAPAAITHGNSDFSRSGRSSFRAAGNRLKAGFAVVCRLSPVRY